MTDSAVAVDGRHVRRQQNVAAVVDALHELWSEGNFNPGAKEIAARSGVSLRSVFRYFDDMDTLVSTAIDRLMSDTDHHFAPLPGHGSLGERSRRLASHRVRYHADVEAIIIAVRLHAPGHPAVALVITQRTNQLRDQLARLFATELATFNSTERFRRLVTLETLTGIEAVTLLRRTRQIQSDEVEQILTTAIARTLT